MKLAQAVDRTRLVDAAMQRIPCDLTITNIQLVNVFTGEIYPASVDVLDGHIVRVRTQEQSTQQPSRQIYDGLGAYLLPGFIDAHMHVESTMMIPENLSRAVVPWGTTTAVTDPHEIANVLGIDGVQFMLENGRKSSLRQYVLAPSCVPAAPELEGAGATFGAQQVGQLLDLPGVIGIAELMDFVGVISNSPRMTEIMEQGIQRGGYLQGHSPTLVDKELAAYQVSGVVSDHESLSRQEVQEKLRGGMHINLRASSIIDNILELIEGCKHHRWRDNVSICTDDVHAEVLHQQGHVNRTFARVIQAGIDPVEAVKMATLNTAREYGFDNLGAVAPGYLADMQLVDALDGRRPNAVFVQGKLVAENGEYLAQDDAAPLPAFVNSVAAPQVTSAQDLRLPAPQGCGSQVTVNVLTPAAPGSIFMTAQQAVLPVTGGYVDISALPQYQFVCVCNRYGSGEMTIGVLKDFGLQQGAYATTVSHDSHNLVAVYRDCADGFVAMQQLIQCGGGFCAVLDQKPIHTLPLPVAGLMSPLPCDQIAVEIETMQRAAAQLFGEQASVLQASLLSLPCIPGIVVTDKGIVNGMTQTVMDCFA